MDLIDLRNVSDLTGIDINMVDTNTLAPEMEPNRQLYFMAKSREYVKRKSEELGRNLTVHITTFGCQMNAKDSEKLLGILEKIGYEETDDEKAAVAGIEAMEDYYRSVGMPTSLCELGIHATEEQIKEMADKCSFYGKRTVGVMKKIGAPEAAEIYRMANDKSIPLYSR